MLFNSVVFNSGRRLLDALCPQAFQYDPNVLLVLEPSIDKLLPEAKQRTLLRLHPSWHPKLTAAGLIVPRQPDIC